MELLLCNIWFFFYFLGFYVRPFNPFLMFFGYVCVIDGVFNLKGYINKTYFSALLGIIVLFGAYLLLYVSNYLLYYYSLAMFIGILIIFSLTYLHRQKHSKLTWKNEW